MYFDSEQKKRLRRKGERRKMKAYVTVRDVMLVLPVKDTQARKILHNLRRQKNKAPLLQMGGNYSLIYYV